MPSMLLTASVAATAAAITPPAGMSVSTSASASSGVLSSSAALVDLTCAAAARFQRSMGLRETSEFRLVEARRDGGDGPNPSRLRRRPDEPAELRRR